MSAALLALTVAGFALAVAGMAWNAFDAPRRRLGPGEAANVGRGRPGAPLRRFSGKAAGVEWSDEMSFTELKQGLRDGTWRHSARLQQFVLVVVGGITGIFGLALLIGWHTRPVGLVAAAGVVGYAAVQLALGFRRA